VGKREAGDERRRQGQSGGQREGSSAPTTEQRSRGAEGAQRKKKRGKRSGGLIYNLQKVQGPLSKLKISTDIEIK
jgi:hypothetical protein